MLVQDVKGYVVVNDDGIVVFKSKERTPAQKFLFAKGKCGWRLIPVASLNNGR